MSLVGSSHSDHAGVIERWREREYAGGREPTKGRFVADGPAQGRWNSHRSAGVGTEPGSHDAGSDGDGSTATRSAGDTRFIDRISCVP